MERKGVMFNGTKEQEDALLAVIERHERAEGRRDPRASRGTGDLWLSSHRGAEDHCRGAWNVACRYIRNSDILCKIHAESQGKQRSGSLSWHGLLCKGLRTGAFKGGGDFGYRSRRVHVRQELLYRGYPLHRCMRTCSGHDYQRRCVRAPDGGRCSRHNREIPLRKGARK